MLRLLFLGLVLLGTHARAQDISALAAVEVLPGWRAADGTHVAALRIDLAPGWKTYWRSPGDAGIPPAFDLSASDNLASVAVHWPVPTAIDSAGLTAIGYPGDLVLPLVLTAVDPARAITLDGRMDLGVCADICVPVSATLRAALEATPDQRRDARIRTALADRPQSAAEAGAGRATCTLEPSADGGVLTASVAMPSLGAPETAVVELRDRAVWVGPARTVRDGGTLTATVEMAPPRGAPLALDRSGVRLTVLGQRGAVDLQGCD